MAEIYDQDEGKIIPPANATKPIDPMPEVLVYDIRPTGWLLQFDPADQLGIELCRMGTIANPLASVIAKLAYLLDEAEAN